MSDSSSGGYSLLILAAALAAGDAAYWFISSEQRMHSVGRNIAVVVELVYRPWIDGARVLEVARDA
jgi:hypothetical protein